MPGTDGGVARAATGRDVDDVERRERGDDGHRDAHADLVAEAGQRDRDGTPANQPAPSIRADSYSAGSILVMPVSSRTRAEAEQHPDADQADRGERRVEVTQPGPGRCRRGRRADSTWLTSPGQRQQPAPDDAGGDERDDLRQEQHRPRQRAQPAGGDPVDHRGDRPARAAPGSKLKNTTSLNALNDRARRDPGR